TSVSRPVWTSWTKPLTWSLRRMICPMPAFVPGIQLAAALYEEVVRPVLGTTPHSAARLGWGSDVLGYDTERSTDHGWGPSLQVFVDGLGRLLPLRERLAWYPDQVWLWLLACQWRRIAQEEAFAGRAAEVGDQLGSRLVGARLARDLVRLALLQERRYAPYAKWLGTAFARLEVAPALTPHLEAAVVAPDFPAREDGLVAALELLARRHDRLGLTRTVDPAVRSYHGCPIRVPMAARVANPCV